MLSDNTYVRNYATSGALDELCNDSQIDFLVAKSVSLRQPLSRIGKIVGEFEISGAQNRLHNLHFQLMMWRYRKRSKTFFYRWLRNTNWSLVSRRGGLKNRALSLVRWFISASANPDGLRIPLLANPLAFPLVAPVVRSKFVPNDDIRACLREGKYDAILFPSSAFEAANVDLVRIGRELGVPTVCLIDNWDNLTSKTVFWERPDHLAVWGEQAREQAMRIHQFPKESVHPLGTPRFESYFSQQPDTPAQRHYPFPYILYVGSAMPFDEIGSLRELEKFLSRSTEFDDSLKVVYRPHPWQQKRISPTQFLEEEFSRVILDRQISNALEGGAALTSRSSSFQPELSYYPDLLRGAACVVGPLTTMLLEATLCLRPTIGLSYFDGYHANTSQRYFNHFDGLDDVPTFQFCKNPDQLPGQISQALRTKRASSDSIWSRTSYFVINSPGTYSKRLRTLVSQVMGK